MPGLTRSTPDVYLSIESGEPVLRSGLNPNRFAHSDKRVLIIGGGVTGLTVSSIPPRSVALLRHYMIPDGVDASRCWLLCHYRLRQVGMQEESNYVPNCWCAVSSLFASVLALQRADISSGGSGHLQSVVATPILFRCASRSGGA